MLEEENIFVIDETRGHSQDIRPLKIVILNLMPLKITTETDLIRLLSNTPLQVDITFMKLKSHTSKNTPVEHMQQFYVDFDMLRERKFDGMIITGAPLDDYTFEEVTYWKEIQSIFSWARTHVTSTMYICWAALAALYEYHEVGRVVYPKKLFGIFKQNIIPTHRETPLFRGFDSTFCIPQSRHMGANTDDILACHDIEVLSAAPETGPTIMMARDGREIYVTGHFEYNPDTLDTEYRRDLGKRDDVELPLHYYIDNDPNKGPVVSWRAHANLFFQNWINYYVYQKTPYDINLIS